MTKKRFSPMIKEVLSQIFAKPATEKYPLVKAEVPDNFRGRQVFDIDLCVSCGLCARDCPSKAIEMVEVNGKRRPLFHLDLCIFCYQCAESCPRNAIQSSVFYELASINKSDLILDPKISAQKGKGD